MSTLAVVEETHSTHRTVDIKVVVEGRGMVVAYCGAL